MKKVFFLFLYISLTVISSFAADRDELFTRPPVRGRFYKMLGTDGIYSWKNIVADEVAEASGILGKIHLGLPYIASATHNPVYTTGIRILAASDVTDATSVQTSLNWYTNQLIASVSTWVMDQSTVSDASAPVVVIYATDVVSVTHTSNYISTNILYATTVIAEAIVNEKYTQEYAGDGGTDTVSLDYVAYTEGFIVESVTDPPISHVNEWVLNSNYTQNLDGDGHVTSIDLVSGYRWYPHMTFRIRYVRADL